jgi:hypothetical protein
MRNLNYLNRYRLRGRDVMELWDWEGDETCGAFIIDSPIDRAPLKVVASSGESWDHVSVSRRNRCPNYAEMEHVIKLFAESNETWMQLHVPADSHVNMMPFCLHWWRPLDAEIPRPPATFVGIGNTPARTMDEAKKRVDKAERTA